MCSPFTTGLTAFVRTRKSGPWTDPDSEAALGAAAFAGCGAAAAAQANSTEPQGLLPVPDYKGDGPTITAAIAPSSPPIQVDVYWRSSANRVTQ